MSSLKGMLIVHYDTSAMKRFLTSVSLQHEPKATDALTVAKKTFFRTSIVRNFISRGVKMRVSAREACVKPHLRTRSDIIKRYINICCQKRSYLKFFNFLNSLLKYNFSTMFSSNGDKTDTFFT